jgi:hypothetical protein
MSVAETVQYGSGDARSPANAVCISGLGQWYRFLDAELRWLWDRFPSAWVDRTGTIDEDDRHLEVLAVQLPDGERVALYFEVAGLGRRSRLRWRHPSN